MKRRGSIISKVRPGFHTKKKKLDFFVSYIYIILNMFYKTIN